MQDALGPVYRGDASVQFALPVDCLALGPAPLPLELQIGQRRLVANPKRLGNFRRRRAPDVKLVSLLLA